MRRVHDRHRRLATIRNKAIVIAALTVLSAAEPINAEPVESAVAKQSDGQHHFDWEFDTWNTHVRVLPNPLSGETPDWANYEGTSIVKPLMGGRAYFVERSVKGPAGAIEGGV